MTIMTLQQIFRRRQHHVLAGTGGFLLLKDYQQVRVLRTLEQWVTSEAEVSVAN